MSNDSPESDAILMMECPEDGFRTTTPANNTLVATGGFTCPKCEENGVSTVMEAKARYEKVSDEPSGESDHSTDSGLPVAAIVSFVGEESHEFEAYGTDETDLTYKDDVEQGDKVVLKSDAEDAIQEARRQERREILNKLDNIEERFHNGDKATAGILNPADLVTEVLETVEEELRDDLQQEEEDEVKSGEQ